MRLFIVDLCVLALVEIRSLGHGVFHIFLLVCCYSCYHFCCKPIFALQVILQRVGLLTARGSLAGGGVIQIKSSEDVLGICDSKFDVTGSTVGLVNILGEYK